MSVGIGESNYPLSFVEKGEPDERIRIRDIKFMAEKMNLKMPPLPISHWEEIRIFNDFMKENNKLSPQKCIELATIFKKKQWNVCVSKIAFNDKSLPQATGI